MMIHFSLVTLYSISLLSEIHHIVGAILYGCPFLYFTQTKNAISKTCQFYQFQT
jgi:hypothetical protein